MTAYEDLIARLANGTSVATKSPTDLLQAAAIAERSDPHWPRSHKAGPDLTIGLTQFESDKLDVVASVLGKSREDVMRYALALCWQLLPRKV